mgnify:FL=1
MRCRMITGNIAFAAAVYFVSYRIAHIDRTFNYTPNLDRSAVRQFFGIFNFNHTCRSSDTAQIT